LQRACSDVEAACLIVRIKDSEPRVSEEINMFKPGLPVPAFGARRCRPAIRLVVGLAAVSTVFSLTACEEPGRAYFYRHTGYNGGVASRADDDSTFTNNTFSDGSPMNDNVSSVSNQTGRWILVYNDSNYGGWRMCIGPGGRVFDMGHYGGANDDASAVDMNVATPPPGCTWRIEGNG
jgi:hypothetical protein